MKKLIKLFSIATMVAAGAATFAVNKSNVVSADNETFNVYFSDNWGSKYDFYFHGWGNGEDVWISMSSVYKNENNQQVYLASSIPSRITGYQFQFKDNGGNNGAQRTIYTVNCTDETNNLGYYFDNWNDGTPTLKTWECKPYTIAFDANGGSGTMTSVTAYDGAYGDGTTKGWGIKKNTFTKENCDFIGWNTQADGNGVSYSDQQTIVNGTYNSGTVTLYAQWVNKRQIVVGDTTYETTEKQDASPWEYYKKGVDFKKDDTIQAKYHQGGAYSLTIEDGGAKSCFGNDGKSLINCKLDVYLKSRDDGKNYNYVYVGFTSDTRGFITTFMSTFQNNICKADGNTNLSDLTTAWNELFADEAIPYYYNTTDKSDVSFNSLYDTIVSKYKSLTDYLGRVPNRSSSNFKTFDISFINDVDETNALPVIIVSVIAVVAIGGFLVYRKRKEN